MRFLAVERAAAEELVSERTLQSTEYENGRALAEFLKGSYDVRIPNPRIEVVRHEDGVFMLPLSDTSPDYVVFDLETCGLFTSQHGEDDVLLFFQRVLRFGIKQWNNLRLSPYERPVEGTSKVVIFPYPISQHTHFRISIEVAPDKKRQSKRPLEGRSLLVYRSGKDEGGGPQENASSTNFRRFLDSRHSINGRKRKAPEIDNTVITTLNVTALNSPPPQPISQYQGYERWLELLTDKQKAFVLSGLKAPHRIEGPAGTGKTLSLILKVIHALRFANEKGAEYRALFITHSEATRRTVEQIIEVNDPWHFLSRDVNSPQILKLTTLQQLCAELLNTEIKETEFLDRDAMDSKQLQLLYVDEALEGTFKQEYPTYKRLLSREFDNVLVSSDRFALAEMFQHEISVVIKGRADEQLENYRKLPTLKYGLPTKTASDRGFVWCVYKRYQSQLTAAAYFDTDDIVLTTIGQLNTPVWRRRRVREAYDGIYIDETHLFNINELSMFHYLSRSPISHPIAYSVDRSQAVGDRGWTDEAFDEALSPTDEARENAERTEVKSIFRCSPEIINLAFSVTSAGATLFTNFDDPLKMASSMFTAEEDRKSLPPQYISCGDDDGMVTLAFTRAELLAKELDASRSEVALVAFTQELFKLAEQFAASQNKAVELLKRRGDIEVVNLAKRSSRFILSTPEYIGGLEFQAVVLFGVDDGRVPPTKTTESVDSANFLSYASHNRLYVAITRARYRVEILGAKDRGPSSLLKGAIQSGILLVSEC